MKFNLQRTLVFLFLGGVALFIGQLANNVYKRYKRDQIGQDFIIINGAQIKKITQVHKSTLKNIDYSFDYNGRNYSNTYPYERGFNEKLNVKDFNTIYIKHLPVLIKKGEPTNNIILFHPAEFKKYKLDFPDSLNWIIFLLPSGDE